MGRFKRPILLPSSQKELELKVSPQNNRLSISVAFSIFAHVLALFLLSLLVSLRSHLAQISQVDVFEVRLSPPATAKLKPETGQKLLAVKTTAQLKISQTEKKLLPDKRSKLAPPVQEKSPANSGEVAGVTFPAAAAPSFQVGQRSINSLFHAPTTQQNSARIYYQQVMEAQARQQTEFQTQLIVQHLQQLLSQELNIKPAVFGKCNLNEDNKLMCDSPALYQAIAKNEMNIAQMIIALRGMGKAINGFSADNRADGLSINLINEAP